MRYFPPQELHLPLFCAVLAALVSRVAVAEPPQRKREVVFSSPFVSVDLDVRQVGLEVEFRTSGSDPYFWFELPSAPKSERDWMLEFEYSCPEGVRDLEWRWGRPPSSSRTTTIPALAPAEGWTTYSINVSKLGSIDGSSPMPVRLDLGNKPGVRLRVREMVIRPMTDAELEEERYAEERRASKLELKRRIDAYTKREWPARIRFATRTGERVQLSLEWNAGGKPENLFAIERFDWSVSATPPSDAELATRHPITLQQRVQTVGLPARARSLRWQLVRQVGDGFESVSPAHYEQPLQASPEQHSEHVSRPLEPRRDVRKGLTCITTRFANDRFGELGLGHASVNVALVGLLRRSPAPGYDPIEIRKQRWYVNTHRLRALEADVQTASNLAGQVAGILLIQRSGSGFGPFAHPEAEVAGTYAMPNLTEEDSVEIYRATLEMLGQRFGASSEIATIDHWIIHNEVDYGWQWTNMGKQPLGVFLDHYIRSMRLASHAMRAAHPDAQVFISLTHRWNTSDNQPWKTYSPRAMLLRLAQLSRLEGDFAWGVAYHPYPQNLWESGTWHDKQVRDDFDTPLITIKNLQVLDRFMSQQNLLDSSGRVRPVLCSEQGFHADETDPASLERQCAALLYTWNKLRECPSIIAFDYHRPVDHPNEGGLRLGLRGLPSPTQRLGNPKPAWDVYRALGTAREEQLFQRYQSWWIEAE
ncbi:MAG: DUF5722 domain-containing protein [Planctomycetota bacterium]